MAMSSDTKIPRVIYGYVFSDLSYKQAMSALRFQKTVEPWLVENIGEFGKTWTVEIDKEYDDLRLQFPDQATETWFQLAWMQRGDKGEV